MEAPNLDQAAVTSTINHYCDECGSVMYEGIMDDVPAWICPECGYFEYK